MTQLIKDNRLASNETARFIPLAEFSGVTDTDGIAVIINADEEVEQIANDLDRISAIALDFPVFSDGRAYSTAAVLRGRLGYKGEIRAVGDVRLDQLEQMARCGFNAFELNDSVNPEHAIGRLSGYSHSYQQTIDRAPLFRQRA